jgi:hypothetical protein
MPAFINNLSHSAYKQMRRNDVHLFVVSFTDIHAVKTKAGVEIMGHKRNEDRERTVE